MKSSPPRSAIPQPLVPDRAAGTQQADKILVSTGNTSSLVLNRVSSGNGNLRKLTAPGKRRGFPKRLVQRSNNAGPGPDSLYRGNQKEAAGGSQFIWRKALAEQQHRDTGDIESMSLLAGESVGLIDEIRPAAEILRETISGAERLIRELSVKMHENGQT